MTDHDKRVEEIRSRSHLDEVGDCAHHIAPCQCEVDALDQRVTDLLAAYDAKCEDELFAIDRDNCWTPAFYSSEKDYLEAHACDTCKKVFERRKND